MNDRYSRALTRNLYEVKSLFSERNAINKLIEIYPSPKYDFFRFSYYALFNDMIAHGIKVLDQHKDATSFWFLYRSQKAIIDQILAEHNCFIEKIELLSSKLKIIRDKTHFHIDKNAVIDPKQTWKEADITGDFFSEIFEVIWIILSKLYFEHFNRYFPDDIYKAHEFEEYIKVLRKTGNLN